MTHLNISLPEPLRRFVDEKVKSGGYGTVSEYISELVRQAQMAEEDQERLEAALLEGLDSGPGIEVSPEFWKELRAELAERHPKVRKV
jgi:antitoxin ParD1/3/4